MPIHSSLLNKPRLVEKLKKFYEYVNKNDGKVGQKTRGIEVFWPAPAAQAITIAMRKIWESGID